MRITDLRMEEQDEHVRAVAHVAWEDCDRPAQDVFFQTTGEYADALRCDASLFLTGAVIPAARFGERRIAVEGSLCPVNVSGIHAALRQLQQWYGLLERQIVIEPTAGYEPARPVAVPRAGCFLSGGVDSLALLRENRLQFPLDHPRSFQDAILIFGVDMGCHPDFVSHQRKRFADVLGRLQSIAEETRLNLIPIETNVKFLETDYDFWCDWFTGSVMAAVAQSLSGRMTDVSLGSAGWVDSIPPCGTHPFLDNNCGTAGLRIHHEQAHMRRLEKVRLIADWPTALENLRVCFQYFFESMPAEQMNCGQCNRCVYTMLEMVAVGCEDKVPALPASNVTADHISQMTPLSRWAAGHLREVIEPLRFAGRDDLATAVQARLKRHQRDTARWYPRIKKSIQQFDEQVLQDRIRRGLKTVRQWRTSAGF